MSKIISAGFAVLSKDKKMILLGRTNKHNTNGNWTIFKGQAEEGETLIETAIRELREESGIDIIIDDRLNSNTSSSPFYTFGVNDKTVYTYLLHDVEEVLKDFKCKCDSFWDGNPEISEYRWFNLDEASKMVYPSQKGLIEKIKRNNEGIPEKRYV